jgi:FMN-dependent NADH-azoreductase
MPALLQIDSSPRAASVSSRLAAAFVEKWKRQNPGGTVFQHNTSLECFPYLDENAIDAFFTPAEERTAAQKSALAFSDQLVDELLAADVVVLGAPMWNLSIPASLKAWIDLIVREGRTFAFTSQGVGPARSAGQTGLRFFCARRRVSRGHTLS